MENKSFERETSYQVTMNLFRQMLKQGVIDKEEYKNWLQGNTPDKRAPGGESMEELMLRLYKGMQEIIMDMMNEDLTRCALVTHSGIVTSLITAFGLPKTDPKEIVTSPGEGFEVLITAQMWQMSQAFEVLGRVPYYRESVPEDY